MILLIINKVLLIIFILSGLNVCREGFLFGIQLLNEGSDVNYRLSTKSLLKLGLSFAFILASIFTGISL